MNVQLIVCVVAALAAGVLGAVVVSPGDAPASGASADVVELRAQLEDLSRANEELMNRLETLEGRPPVVAMPTDAVADAAPMREVEATPASAPRESGVSAASFQAQVNEALKAIRAQEERERDEEREKRRQERFDEALQKMAEALNLNAYQTGELRAAIERQSERMETARDAMRDSGDWDGMRTAMGEIRDQLTQELGNFMTQEQVDKFGENSRSLMRGIGGFDRGGRGGGGGGGRRGF